MEIKAFLISCLSVRQACKLFGISKNKFNLESRFVIREDCFCIQVLIGRKQEGIIFLFRLFDLLIDQDDDFNIALEALMILVGKKRTKLLLVSQCCHGMARFGSVAHKA